MVQQTSSPSKPSAWIGLLGLIAAFGVVFTGLTTPSLAVASVYSSEGVAAFNSLPEYMPKVSLQTRSSIYYKDKGKTKLLANFYNFNRLPVKSDQISPLIKHAAISVEDPRFYQNQGVDLLSTMRAAVQNTVAGGVQSGSSTITMQLARNMLIEKASMSSSNKEYLKLYREATQTTVPRKIQEIRYAIGLNKQYSKDEILTSYLNTAYFGHNTYGIEAASRYYFGKHANELSVNQAAILGSIFPNASDLNPQTAQLSKSNMAKSKARRDLVLHRMLSQKYITQAQYDQAIKSKIKVNIHQVPRGCADAGANAYFCQYVVRVIGSNQAFGKTQADRINLLNRGGLNIYTTLNPQIQKVGAKSVKYWTPASGKWGGAAVTLEAGTGRILTMVQNRTYDATESHKNNIKYTSINYSTDEAYGGSLGFQPGSSYKLFTLLDWLDKGHSLNERINEAPRTVRLDSFSAPCYGPLGGSTWKVANVARFPGTATVKYATANSVNGGFVTMAQKLDLCDIQDMARKLGIHRANGEPLTVNQPAFIIGGSDNQFSPLTMATAYSVMANDGKLCQPIAIDKITYKSTGKEMTDIPQADCKQVIDKDLVARAIPALRAVMSASGAMANPHDGVPIAGKTGTTNKAMQTWMMGFTTKTITASWAGNTTTPFVPGTGFFTHGVRGQYVRNQTFKAIQRTANSIYGGDRFPTAARQESTTDPNAISVPDVTGASIDSATSTLQNAGFTVNVGGKVSSSEDEGTVARTSPAAGSKASPDSQVTLYPSSHDVIQMPKVLDSSPSDAKAALKDAGFTRVSVRTFTTSNKNRQGVVYAVNATAGNTYAKSSHIILYVGKKP